MHYLKTCLAVTACACWLSLPATAQAPTPSPSPPAPAAPPEASPEDSPEEPELKFRGVLWNSYSSNFNVPSTGKNAFRGYDFDDRKLKLDLLDLDLQYGVDLPDQVGVRLELTGGGSMPRVDAAANLFRDEVTGISTTDFDIRQVFVTYKTDFGLRFDAGKFTTIFGYEVCPGVDGLNPNGTVAWSYTFSPFTHTGLRMIYPVTDQLTLTGLVVTGADTFTDNNGRPSFGGQVAWKPTDEIQLLVNVLNGPERYNNNVDNRRLIDLVGTFQLTDEVKLGVHALSGIERFSQGLDVPYTANWNGLVLYLERLRHQLPPGVVQRPPGGPHRGGPEPARLHHLPHLGDHRGHPGAAGLSHRQLLGAGLRQAGGAGEHAAHAVLQPGAEILGGGRRAYDRFCDHRDHAGVLRRHHGLS